MDGEEVSGLLDRLDHGSVRAAVSEVEARPETDGEPLVVRIIRGWGRIGAGETAHAQAMLRPIVESLESAGEPRIRAHALTALGVACILGGEGDAGAALLERALVLHRTSWPRAQCQRFLALALEQRGAWEGAAGRYAAAAEAYAAIPDDFGRGSALYGAAAAYIELGDEPLARARLDEAVDALRRAGPLPALGSALGLQATFTEDEAEAGALLAESERLTAGTPWMYRSDWLLRAGEVALRFGHPERALALAQDALRVTVPTATEHTWAEHAAAAALVALGRDGEAAQLLDTPPGGEISGAGRLERLSLRLGIAARAGDARSAERALDVLERLGRARHRRRGAPARLAAAADTLARTSPELAARAARLALATGHPEAEVRPLLVRLRDGGVRIPLGPLWLESPVGSGGMGQVWRARHPDGHALAIKLLHTERTGEDVDLFEAEIAAVARLDHPNIVRVYAALRVDAAAAPMVDRPVGSPALVMELVEGGTLADRSDAWGWAETRAILAQLLDALAHAHARGVLHLDLKPGNVLLDRSGRVPVPRLTDFGMAGIVQRTGEGQLFGTPAYLPPEQADGRPLGPPSDLYGLGCLAWHLLTGQPVFGNVAPLVHIARHASGVLPRFEPLHPVPEGTEEWLRTLLAHHPGGPLPGRRGRRRRPRHPRERAARPRDAAGGEHGRPDARSGAAHRPRPLLRGPPDPDPRAELAARPLARRLACPAPWPGCPLPARPGRGAAGGPRGTPRGPVGGA